jgi:hypothetical protein
MVQYTLEQYVFLCDTCEESDIKNFDINFMMKEFPADEWFTVGK